MVTAEFPSFFLVNAYVPNSGEGLKRLDYRVQQWDKGARGGAGGPGGGVGSPRCHHRLSHALPWHRTASHPLPHLCALPPALQSLRHTCGACSSARRWW